MEQGSEPVRLPPAAFQQRSGILAVAVALAAGLLAFQPQARAADSAPRQLAEQALALRAGGLSGGAGTMDMLAAVPGARALDRQALAVLWRPFFSNAVVQLGRMASSGPVALYLDPVLDIAIIAYWRNEGDGFVLASAHALPGARLLDGAAEAAILPPWLSAREDPVGAMAADMAERLAAFGRQHPADGTEAGRNPTRFAAAAGDFRALLPRLAWMATQRARWTDGSLPWLEAVLARVEAALAARDADALLAAAPRTNREMARILAELPGGFVSALALDMVLETAGSQRILIGSLPDDGDAYVVALCNLEGDGCALRSLSLMSLTE